MTVSYHPAKLGGHRHSDIRDVMIFACHVTLLTLTKFEELDKQNRRCVK